MDENLVGYLLNALDADTHRQVEDYLRDNAAARQRIEQLRRALEPLAADVEAPMPPSGLWIRTLAYVAEDRCRRLPPAPKPVTVVAGGSSSRSWWRRSDLLVAASILLLAGLVSIPWLARLRDTNSVQACRNNLHNFHTALVSYSDLHEGDFPKIGKAAPDNVAGVFLPALHNAGVLTSNVKVTCPGNGKTQATVPHSVEELQTLHANRQTGCYAYSLGYETRDDDGKVTHHQLRRDSGDHLPLMGDRPPGDLGSVVAGNSPNHGGVGQNILHVDGRVTHLKEPKINRDDLYLNERKRVAVGVGPEDAVLGATWASPYPPEK